MIMGKQENVQLKQIGKLTTPYAQTHIYIYIHVYDSMINSSKHNKLQEFSTCTRTLKDIVTIHDKSEN